MPTLNDLEQDGLQVRRAPAAQFEVEDGQFVGKAVPYGVETELIPGLWEVFERGAFAKQTRDPARVKICLEHGQIVGKAVDLEDREDGLWVRGEIVQDPDLPEGRKALAMLRNRLTEQLSVGFQQVRGGTDTVERGSGMLVRHRRAALREISLVGWGAYSWNARVTQVRDQQAAAEEARWKAEWRAKFAALGRG